MELVLVRVIHYVLLALTTYSVSGTFFFGPSPHMMGPPPPPMLHPMHHHAMKKHHMMKKLRHMMPPPIIMGPHPPPMHFHPPMQMVPHMVPMNRIMHKKLITTPDQVMLNKILKKKLLAKTWMMRRPFGNKGSNLGKVVPNAKPSPKKKANVAGVKKPAPIKPKAITGQNVYPPKQYLGMQLGFDPAMTGQRSNIMLMQQVGTLSVAPAGPSAVEPVLNRVNPNPGMMQPAGVDQSAVAMAKPTPDMIPPVASMTQAGIDTVQPVPQQSAPVPSVDAAVAAMTAPGIATLGQNAVLPKSPPKPSAFEIQNSQGQSPTGGKTLTLDMRTATRTEGAQNSKAAVKTTKPLNRAVGQAPLNQPDIAIQNPQPGVVKEVLKQTPANLVNQNTQPGLVKDVLRQNPADFVIQNTQPGLVKNALRQRSADFRVQNTQPNFLTNTIRQNPTDFVMQNTQPRLIKNAIRMGPSRNDFGPNGAAVQRQRSNFGNGQGPAVEINYIAQQNALKRHNLGPMVPSSNQYINPFNNAQNPGSVSIDYLGRTFHGADIYSVKNNNFLAASMKPLPQMANTNAFNTAGKRLHMGNNMHTQQIPDAVNTNIKSGTRRSNGRSIGGSNRIVNPDPSLQAPEVAPKLQPKRKQDPHTKSNTGPHVNAKSATPIKKRAPTLSNGPNLPDNIRTFQFNDGGHFGTFQVQMLGESFPHNAPVEAVQTANPKPLLPKCVDSSGRQIQGCVA